MAHRLDPLLLPRSVAVIGATARPGSVGNHTLSNLLAGGFAGNLYPVNPGHGAIAGLRCYASLAELPEVPDLAIFCVRDERIEAALDDAIATGVPAVSVMSTLIIDNDTKPALRERVANKLAAAGIVACGPNGMGFYNVSHRLWACGFLARHHEPPGRVTLISQSGSGMSGLVDCDSRLRFNLAVSTGNEFSVTMDQYIDFALDLPDTRAIGLFVETARNPAGMRAALDKANRHRIPVVAVKVGRTRKAAELTVSHSGAMAGDDATYNALFDRYGVQRVRDMDELATALILLSEWPVPGPGGLVSLHDSGGERQLMIDLADEHAVSLTSLTAATTAKLEAVLDPELPAVNPLDGWSRGTPDYDQQMTDFLSLMLQDPGASVGVVQHDRAPDGTIYAEYIDYLRGAGERSGKPVALVGARQGTGGEPLVAEATHAGYPVLDDVSNFLVGVRCVFGWRDFLAAPSGDHAAAPLRATSEEWRRRLQSNGAPGEADTLSMLQAFGVNANVPLSARSPKQATAAARQLGYPVALKTATAGIAHKSDVGGVVLGLQDDAQVETAYQRMAASLGPAVIVARMQEPGIEMILGAKRDPQFGPVVMIGFGGVYAEILNDVRFALPPFTAGTARALIDTLKLRRLLDGVRGAPPAAIDGFCEMASRFSAMVEALRTEIVEIDVNPVLVSPHAAIAVDALLVSDATDKRELL